MMARGARPNDRWQCKYDHLVVLCVVATLLLECEATIGTSPVLVDPVSKLCCRQWRQGWHVEWQGTRRHLELTGRRAGGREIARSLQGLDSADNGR